MERYELVEGTSAKFWQWEVRGAELFVEYGRIGAKGQSTVKSFGSPSEAMAAAAKLVAEKQKKGYAPAPTGAPAKPAVETPPAVPAKPAPAKPTPTAVATPADAPSLTTLPWIDEAALAELGAKLAKKSKKAPTEIVEGLVGSETVRGKVGRVQVTLAALFERGLIPERLLGEVAYPLVFASDWIAPSKVIELSRLDGLRPLLAEQLLMRLGARAPEFVAASAEGAFTPAVARLLPLVRRRLGLSSEPLAEDVVRDLAREFASGGGSWTKEVRRGAHLMPHHMTTFAETAEWAATIGLGEVWSERVVEASKQGFGDTWRAEPLLRTATLGELATLLRSCARIDGALLFDILGKRNDSPEAWAALALAFDVGPAGSNQLELCRIREAVALVAGARLAKAGADIPTELDDMIWFQDTYRHNERNVAYAAALAAFPRARVLARVALLLDTAYEAAKPLQDLARAGVGLGVHRDEALLRRYLEQVPWSAAHERPAYAGRLAIEDLPVVVARLEALGATKSAETRALTAAIQGIAVGHAERSGTPLSTEHDKWFEPALCYDRALWERAVTTLPQARKDAYMLAWARIDPFEWQRQLSTCSDAAIDEIIGLIFEMRSAKSVNVTYPKGVSFSQIGEMLDRVGPQTIPMVRKHFARFGDADARRLLAVIGMDLHEEATPVDEQRADVPSEELGRILDAIIAHTAEHTLKLATGTLLVATQGDTPRALGRSVTPGQCDVLDHYSERELEGATAGLDAVCLRFTKAAVARWEEVLEGGRPFLTGNVIGLIFGDEAAFDAMKDDDRGAVDVLIEENTAEGGAIATHQGKLLAVYIGEVAVEHHLYWGLDASGDAACLLARFVYR